MNGFKVDPQGEDLVLSGNGYYLVTSSVSEMRALITTEVSYELKERANVALDIHERNQPMAN